MLDDFAFMRLALARLLVESAEPFPVALVEHHEEIVTPDKPIAPQLRLLHRAAKSLGVQTVKVGRVTCWRLPANVVAFPLVLSFENYGTAA
jgi:hypothetical protein